MTSDTATSLELARKVLRIEAAAILGLVDRLDGHFERALQLPGGGDGVTAGQAEFIEPMARAGVAAGVDGVFMEVHQDPPKAKSDAQNALKLDLLPALLDQLVHIHHIASKAAVTR